MRTYEKIFKGCLELDDKALESDNIDQVTNEIVEQLFKKVLESEEEILSTKRNVINVFITNNCERWKVGFDRLESLILLCIEIGEQFNKTYRSKAVKDDNLVFDTLIKHHARACLTAQEILYLLKGGFADAALARWRTLHEVHVTTRFIEKHGHDCAERFYYHGYIEKYKAAFQMSEYEDRLNTEGPTEDELNELKKIRDKLIAKYGKSFAKENGWACPYIYPNIDCENEDKKKVSFIQIEKDVLLDHMRPYYKWASKNTHATHDGLYPILGLSEAKEEILLVGQSNSGMTVPAHSLALSLMQVTAVLLNEEIKYNVSSSLDTLVTMKLIKKLEVDIGNLFLELAAK